VPSNAEAEVVSQMCERTQGPITVVADSSKWGVVSNFEVISIGQVQRLVTDDGLAASARASLAARNVEILMASQLIAVRA
jgi:DeoR/GlpR family transcriptional regulator of sugar metabolism